MPDDTTTRAALQSFSPIFPVSDLRRSMAHYAALGFSVTSYDEAYGFADRDGVSLHLSHEAVDHHEHADGSGHEHELHARSAYLYVTDADALYDEWARPGLGGLTRRVGDTDYKLREGSHVDPDGNVLRFGSPMPSRPAEQLKAHLEAEYGIAVTAMTDLDVGVWRVGRADGQDWVARWFPPARTQQAVQGDAEILRYLDEHDYPAEVCAATDPVSNLDDRSVLVTEWADAVPRQQRRDAIRAVGGLQQLGALLGQLHTLPTSAAPKAVTRPGGAWHHLADGKPAAEVAAATEMLSNAAHLFPGDQRADYEKLCAHVQALDSGEGLPEALTHPDFVLANVVATGDDMILVDWAGAGRGPRAWSLAFFLFAEAMKDPRRAGAVLKGYCRHVTLTEAELGRLAGLIQARPLTLDAWNVCTGRKTPAEALAAAAATKTLAETVAARVARFLAS